MKHVPARRLLARRRPGAGRRALSAQQSPPPADTPAACAGGALDPTCGQLGTPRLPLPAEPIILETAEQPKIRVVTLTKELVHPWGLAFLPDGACS